MTFLEALILGVLETEDTETHKDFSVKESPSRRQRVNSSAAWAGHGETLAAAVATENSWNRHFLATTIFWLETRWAGRVSFGGVSSSRKWEGGMTPESCWREKEGNVPQSRAQLWKMASPALH